VSPWSWVEMLKVSRDCSELSAGHGGEVGPTKTTREPKN